MNWTKIRSTTFNVQAEADCYESRNRIKMEGRGIVLTEGGWCHPVSKRSHHSKKGIGQEEVWARGSLGVSAVFAPTPRPFPAAVESSTAAESNAVARSGRISFLTLKHLLNTQKLHRSYHTNCEGKSSTAAEGSRSRRYQFVGS